MDTEQVRVLLYAWNVDRYLAEYQMLLSGDIYDNTPIPSYTYFNPFSADD